MDSNTKFDSVTPCQCQRNSAIEQLKYLMLVVKNNTTLDIIKDRTVSVGQTKYPESKYFGRVESILANCYKCSETKAKSTNKWH